MGRVTRSRSRPLFALASLILLACRPFGDGSSDGSAPSSDPTTRWVGKWHGVGSYTITMTGHQPLNGPAPMDLTVEKGDAATSLHVVGQDGKGFDLFIDPAHPDSASTTGAVAQGNQILGAVGDYAAAATLANGKMHLVSQSKAHGTLNLPQIHSQADAKTVVLVDLDRVK